MEYENRRVVKLIVKKFGVQIPVNGVPTDFHTTLSAEVTYQNLELLDLFDKSLFYECVSRTRRDVELLGLKWPLPELPHDPNLPQNSPKPTPFVPPAANPGSVVS